MGGCKPSVYSEIIKWSETQLSLTFFFPDFSVFNVTGPNQKPWCSELRLPFNVEQQRRQKDGLPSAQPGGFWISHADLLREYPIRRGWCRLYPVASPREAPPGRARVYIQGCPAGAVPRAHGDSGCPFTKAVHAPMIQLWP